MRNNLKVCRRVVLKTQQDFHLFRMRANNQCPHTPKILLGKTEGFYQQIFTDNLSQQPLLFLKDLKSNQKAFIHARSVISACINLASAYGYFIINQNMVFFDEQHELIVWINPEILQNHVKIYLPPSPQGEQAMIRSIIIFLKLWLRCDFTLLSESLHLRQLLEKLKPLRIRPFELIKIKTTGDVQGSRRNSVNIYDFKFKSKESQNGSRFAPQPLICNKNSNKQPIKHDYSPQSTQCNKFLKNNKHINESIRVDSAKESKNLVIGHQKAKEVHFQNQTFANVYELPHSRASINGSLGLKSYFPNKTTSNKNHIVRMIMEYDEKPDQFGKNKIMMEEEREDRAKLRKLKESLHGIIGEELNDLFQSAILDDNQRNILDSYIQKQFQNLLE